MSFSKISDDVRNGSFERRVFRNSEGDLFEVNVTVVMFGYRVCVGPVSDDGICYFYDANICSGASQEMLEKIYTLVMKIVEKNDTSQVRWPEFVVKPVWKDPSYMVDLTDMAGNFDEDEIVDLTPVGVIRMLFESRFLLPETD